MTIAFHELNHFDQAERIRNAPVGAAVDNHSFAAVFADDRGHALRRQLGDRIDRHPAVAARFMTQGDGILRVVVR